jgi:hypothetical protein
VLISVTSLLIVLFVHLRRLHASPVKPGSHTHFPAEWSQVPRFEHTAGKCARSVATATSFHALPAGHSPRSIQSFHLYPESINY